MARGKIDDPEKERERGRKISEARKRKFQEQGYLNSFETRQKIGKAHKGKSLSDEAKQKLSNTLQGKIPKNFVTFQELGHAAARERSGSDIPNWKGDDVGYVALQVWVAKWKGKPNLCDRCGTTEAKKYHWISMSGERKRDLADWIRLCVTCHWRQIHQTQPKKETNGDGRFQPGQVPYNKGKKMLSYSGDKHPHWKGGITEANHAIRTSLEYKLWRRAVFARDHFTCVLCGHRSRLHGRGKCDIRADHIQPFHAFPALRFVVENGRTLCIPCDLQYGWQPWRTNAQLLGVEGKKT